METIAPMSIGSTSFDHFIQLRPNAPLTDAIDEYAVFMIDPNGYITSWDPGAESMLRYHPDEAIGQHFSKLYLCEGDEPDAWLNALREAKSCGRYIHEGWKRLKDHSRIYVHSTLIPLVDHSRNHFGFANIFRDMSAQKDSLEQLKVEIRSQSNAAMMHERRVRVMTDVIPGSIAEFDTEQRFRFANEYCQRSLGKSDDHLIGKRLIDEVNSDTYQTLQPYITSVLNGVQVSFELEHKKNGLNCFYYVNYVPEFDLNGKVTGFVAFATDITQIKQAKLAAESANNAKSSFLANMAHEIRTPLGAVLGFSELLLRENVSANDRKIYQSAIMRNGSLLSNIINDVLDFAKIEAGMLQLDRRDIDLKDILNDTVSTLEFHAIAKKIQLTITVAPNTPNVIFTDPSRLKQVLLNIVGNAIKFTEQGHVSILVEPDICSYGVRFIVADTGIGISSEQAAKLFMPFKQSEDFSRRRFCGTGLGLALSRQMAQLLGGDVQLTKTELGKGSVFTISIESTKRSVTAFDEGDKKNIDHCSRSTKSHESVLLPLHDASILLVEDSPDNQILVSKILQSAGAKVTFAQNGSEALRNCAESQFDAIVMDLQMPIMDGYEAARELRSAGDATPIIALTAHAMREEHDRCLAVGINIHLAKPIDTEKLVATLQLYCRPKCRTALPLRPQTMTVP